MNTINSFSEKEIPYSELKKVGLSKEMVLNAPPKLFLSPLLKGELTPMVELRQKTSKGYEATYPARLRLSRDKHGQAYLQILPFQKELKREIKDGQDVIGKLNDEQMAAIQRGEIIRKELTEQNNRRIYLLQLDRETNNILRAKLEDIKIPSAIQNVELGLEQKKRIKEGKPLEVEVNGSKVTAGVDLKSPTGFRISNGDVTEWEKQKMIAWDIANPDKVGYWQTTENMWEYQQSMQKYETQQSQHVHVEREQQQGMKR